MQLKLDYSQTTAGGKLRLFKHIWQAIPHIGEIVTSLSENLDTNEYCTPQAGVFIHKTAEVCPSALILPPCIICAGAQIRHCAFIRGKALIGENCVVGNSSEIKNAILFNGVQVPHFNYVGDSILGYKAHLGAGVVLSNVKADKSNVFITCGGQKTDTGLKKLGSVLGDRAEIGCNSVLAPGTLIGANAVVYPTSFVRGVVPENCIFKGADKIIHKS